jgi:hypothetical protein
LQRILFQKEFTMRIAITGSSGLIGSELTEWFHAKGESLSLIVRGQQRRVTPHEVIYWRPGRSELEPARLEGHDVIIHLAGAGLADSRWTEERKQLILDSRVLGTELLATTLARLNNPPTLLVCASAVGYYGNRESGEIVDEDGSAGQGFLSEVCRRWEAAADPAREAGIRTVHSRFGMVLSRKGGALQRMLPVFNKGIGGRLGSGRQIVSWIALPEIPYIMQHVIESEGLGGPVNFVAPQPVSNKEFTDAVGRAINRPTALGAPAFALKLAYGQMAEETLLSGARVVPRKLLDSGYQFKYPELGPALKQILTES